MDIKDRVICEPVNKYTFRIWINITDIAKKLFGDVVTKVEIAAYISDQKDQLAKATSVLNLLNTDFEKYGIRFDGEELRITFINGKQIEIWNSETGGIMKISK